MHHRRSFAGARCLVTGASSGLGQAIAEDLVRAGARVLMTGRSADRLSDVARKLMDQGAAADDVQIVAADLTLKADRDRVIAAARDRFHALDLAVNAAGVGAAGHFDTHDPSVLRAVFEINVFALIEMTREMLPLLRAGQAPALINVGSIVARRAIPGRSEYSASKFAVAGFTESIRAEWSRFGIHVLLLNPGFTATDFEQNQLVDTARIKTIHKRRMTASEVASRTLKAVRQGRHELVLTTEGRLLLLVNRLLPRLVDFGFFQFTRRVFPDSLIPAVSSRKNTSLPRPHWRHKIRKSINQGD